MYLGDGSSTDRREILRDGTILQRRLDTNRGIQSATEMFPLKGEARGVAHSFNCMHSRVSCMRLTDALVLLLSY